MADIDSSDQGSRSMPDFVRKGLIQVQGGQWYLKAASRVLWMRSEHVDWSVVTSIEYADYEKGFAVVRAVIMDGEGRILATAHAEESRGKLPYLRKAETASIARALALCGYGTQFGELTEEEFSGTTGNGNDQDRTAAPRAPRSAANAPGGGGGAGLAGTPWDGPGSCPSCKAPAGKKHASNCAG